MAKTQPSGIYKLPNTDWYNDDTSVMLEEIMESGEIDNIGIPEDILTRFNDSDDMTEITDWFDEHVIQLLEPVQ